MLVPPFSLAFLKALLPVQTVDVVHHLGTQFVLGQNMGIAVVKRASVAHHQPIVKRDVNLASDHVRKLVDNQQAPAGTVEYPVVLL